MQVSGASVGNALQSGAVGIQRGQEQIDVAAQEIASQESKRPAPATDDVQKSTEDRRQLEANKRPDETGETSQNEPVAAADSSTASAEDLVELRQGERQVEASAQVVESADEALGSIIDVRA